MRFFTKRLYIRDLEYNDYQGYYEIYSNRLIASRAGVKTLNGLSEARFFVISLLSNSSVKIYTVIYEEKIIGTISSFYVNKKGIEIGYAIKSEYQRKGFAYEMLEKFIEIIKTNRNLSFVQAKIDDRNVASKGLVKKLGFIEVINSFIDENEVIKKYRLYL